MQSIISRWQRLLFPNTLSLIVALHVPLRGECRAVAGDINVHLHEFLLSLTVLLGVIDLYFEHVVLRICHLSEGHKLIS